MMLYPLKFKPILKNRIWGGSKLGTLMNKAVKNDENIGESWELSGLEGNESVVENGYLAGNTINELVEVYLDELVGQKVYDTFGQSFPLLFKFIDANDKLSVQVHPDDDMAQELYGTNGKTEMWYIIDAEKDAELYIGFDGKVDAKQCEEHIKNGTLADVLTVHKVKKGDAYFIPAGTVHAIGKGIILAEIQQSSDITYRLFDYDRKDKDGNKRELHLENALNALHYEYKGEA
ncbi:MAG: class I mannose-6-phosphate isomerase, partial [Paludibacteraceae bacterium]|nr:class I mannose-6-phosphate isomerase [Paludibacteraceae bacterium]